MKNSRARSPKATSQLPSRNHRSVLTHLSCFALGLVVATSIGVLLAPRGHSSLPAGPRATSVERLTPKPWGEIEYASIQLERPDESFGNASVPLPPTTWFFQGQSESRIAQLLRAPDLTPEQQRLLADRSRWHAKTNGWLLLPSPEVIRTLSPEARRRIYAILRSYPENPFHQNPAHFAATEFDDWLAQCHLPDAKKEIFRSLTYREGDQVLFADFEYMEAQCTLEERRNLARAISQSPCLYMKIRINPDTDVDALLRYWGRGGRGKAMKPFIQSLTRVPGGTSIGASFFFPDFARTRLYTYPDEESDRDAARQDCFYTAMNFFNRTPDSRLFNPEFFRKTLESDYTQVPTNWTFGDILTVLSEAGAPIHMCVYIADDVVFTKNGLDTLEPWRLVKIPEMMRTYAPTGTERLTAFRRKDLPN